MGRRQLRPHGIREDHRHPRRGRPARRPHQPADLRLATGGVSILASRIEWFIEPSDWSGRDGDTARIIIDYYRILEDLGYEPADDETEHLDRLVANITEAAQSDDEDEEADE